MATAFANLSWGVVAALWMAAAHPVVAAPGRVPPDRQQYAGAEACVRCHPRHARHFASTAHALTSSWPTAGTIKAPATRGANVVRLAADRVEVTLDADGYFQTATPVSPGRQPRRERIDLVTGSGRHGQSFIWRRGDELFQLPLSYWTEAARWAPSPGFTGADARFDRAITPLCLDCHATYVASTSRADRFDLSTALLGVTCEKCHGPGAAHVAARSSRPAARLAIDADVVNPATLSREQRVDLCAYCHGGTPLTGPFTFRAGDPVGPSRQASQATAAGTPPGNASVVALDSHGQQAPALQMSRCYQASTMTCETCHDVHETQRDLAAMSKKCQACHAPQACGLYATRGRTIATQCVDCHMPVQASSGISTGSDTSRVQPRIRSHVIRVYGRP
ncbi:MAG: hypothetical protein JSU08_09480 [Acidobacteria bacterium]|nr:hypothetical protein [Acidobacteriota bacterium]